MKNLIRGHMYQLKKDNFFYGCLAAGFLFLMASIRLSSFSMELSPVTGVENLIGTFFNGDIVLYAFMLLTTNMIAEAYRSGVMKNMIGRGLSKKQYYFSVVFTISAAYLLVMLIISIVMGILAYSRFGMGTILYPGYYALSILARILFVMVHISFAVTMAILTRNAITGIFFGLLIPNVPQILEMAFGFLKIHISLDFLKVSTHMPSVYAASNDVSFFLPCIAVLSGYFILSIFAGFRVLKYQDIK